MKECDPIRVHIVEDCGLDGRGKPKLMGVYTDERLAKERSGDFGLSRTGWAIQTEDGRTWILANPLSVSLNCDTAKALEHRREQILESLSVEERFILGYES